MGLYTTDVIVLRRYLYRETSVIVTCLTERHGKLKGLVKGLRAHPNRHRSAMEPLTINRIVFYDTRTSQIHLISSCDLVSPLPQIQGELETAKAGAFFVDLVDTVVPLEEPQPAIYHLLKDTLERLALGGSDLSAVRVHFILRLLRLTGFQPQLGECTGCNTVVKTQGFWSARQGGLLCQACLPEDPQAEPAPPELLEALDALSQSNQPPAIALPLIPTLRERLDDFLRWRLDRPLKTMAAR